MRANNLASAGGTTAGGGTTVTGADDASQPLIIDPTVGQQTVTPSMPYGSGPIFFIQDLPTSRTINAVTLGDFARGADCGYRDTVALQLSIVEIASGQYSDPNATTVATATVNEPNDWAFHRLTWSFGETQLTAGRAYEFVLSNDNYGACGGATVHVWAHNSGVVNAGAGQCAQMEADTYYATYRYWHVQGQNDVNPYCPYGYDLPTQNFDPKMPTGWLELYDDGGNYPPPWVPDATTNYYYSRFGCSISTPLAYETAAPYTASDGTTKHACEFTGYTAPGQTTADGWYFALSWPSGVPDDMFLQLDDAGGAGAGGAAGGGAAAASPSPSSTAGGSNAGAGNLRPCPVGDPVDCASGNFYLNETDVSVPGRGVPVTFTRTYNAIDAAATPGPLGPGWSTSFSAHLEFVSTASGANEIIAHNDNGSTVSYQQNTDGSYSAASFVTASLAKNADGSYTYTLKNGLAYNFTATGALTSIIDRNGYATTVSYSGGRVDHVTDPEGRTLQYAYNSNAQLASVTDPAGRTVSYAYDGAGDLISVTDVALNTTQYAYNAQHLLTQIEDPRGGITTNAYDPNGRVVSQTDRAGASTTLAYASTGGNTSKTTITDPRGEVTSEAFASGQITAETVAVGTASQAAWGYSYDGAHNLASVTAPDGAKQSYSYDSNGNLLTKVDGAGDTTTYTYNGLNEPLTITDPDGETTTFAYDQHGNPTGTSRPLAGTNQVAYRTYGYDPAHPGDVISSTNADGQSTHYGYNTNGYLTSVTDPDGNQSSYSYNTIGWRTSSVSPRGNANGANPANYQTTYTYNPYGEVASMTDPLGNVTKYGYDQNGSRISTTDPNGNITTTAYDADNRPISVTQPDGAKITTAYDADGNVTAVTDGLGHATGYSYNARNERTQISDPLGRQTQFNYDLTGRRTSATNANGQTTQYSYDNADRLTEITYNSSSTPDVSYSYDHDGHRTQMTDGTGTSSWSYDSLGRLTSQTVPSAGEFGRLGANGTPTLGLASSETTSYVYDLAAQITHVTYSNDSTVASLFGATPTITRTYDPAGRLSSLTDWLGQTTGFKYNPDGNLTETDYANATTATTTYNNDDQPTNTTDTGPSGTFLNIPYTRDKDGQITSTGLLGASSSATQTLAYDANNRLTGATADLPTGTGLNKNAYAYNNGDQLTSIGELGQTLNASYDNADQLTQTVEPNIPNSTTTYTYDQNGNRTGESNPAGLSVNYSYNQNDQLTRYRHPAQNLLNGLLPTTATQTATDTTYSYTGDGLRADLLWDRTTPIPEILADATRLYIYGPDGTPIEQVAPGGTITYYHTDQLGSIRALTDKNGRALALYNYDPYGNQTAVKATNLIAPFGYAGQYTEPATGLIYMRARWYDPQTAQFLTPDPLGYASGSQDPYAYTNNNPTNLTDPTGLAGCNPSRALNATLRRLQISMGIAAAMATARASSSGSIVGTEIAIAQLEATDGLAANQAIAEERAIAVEEAATATGLSGAEQATLPRLEALPSSQGLTFTESDHVGAEVVDNLGRSYDFVGDPAASNYWNFQQFTRSIAAHLLKSNDFTVVDVTGFTAAQQSEVAGYLDTLPESSQSTVIRIGF